MRYETYLEGLAGTMRGLAKLQLMRSKCGRDCLLQASRIVISHEKAFCAHEHGHVSGSLRATLAYSARVVLTCGIAHHMNSAKSLLSTPV